MQLIKKPTPRSKAQKSVTQIVQFEKRQKQNGHTKSSSFLSHRELARQRGISEHSYFEEAADRYYLKGAGKTSRWLPTYIALSLLGVSSLIGLFFYYFTNADVLF